MLLLLTTLVAAVFFIFTFGWMGILATYLYWVLLVGILAAIRS